MEVINRDVIVKRKTINAGINRVWKAISEQEEISAWFIQADFQAEVGYKYTFTHENTQIIGEVLEVRPVTKLVYTWEVKGTQVATTVTWTLKEEGDSTTLEIEHKGIASYPSEEITIKMFENYNGGWDECILGLENHLA